MADKFLKPMIHKLTYEKPQSEIVRLQAPMLLTGGSKFVEKDGEWEPEGMIFRPGSFEDLL